MAGAVTSFSGLSVDPVATVAYYLANKATLDAAGNIAIADTAANVSANIDALNADAKVTSIALTDSGTPTLALTVAQALNDTHALGAITNASYAIAVTDTAANISANFDALNADAHVTSIAPSGSGTQVLTLTVAQVLNDTRALSILDPFTITVTGTAASLQGLTPAQMTSLSSSGVTLLEATDEDVAFTTAQKQALGAAGIALEQPYSGGTVEVINYSASGAVSSVQYLGIVDAAYSSYTVIYGANGKQTSASYSNGMTATWTLNANGSYDIAFAGVTGAAYTSCTVDYGANGEPESASYSNGMTATWTYNPGGSFDVAYVGVTGAAYTSYTVDYGANDKQASASYSNGMTVTWTWNTNGSYDIAYAGVTGATYTSYTVDYGANGEPESASYSNGMTATWTYNPGGSFDVAYVGVTGAAYTSYTVDYGANDKQASASYSNGMTVTWTWNTNGSYDIAYAGVTGAAYTSYTVDYGANGEPESASYSNGMTATWTFKADGSYEGAYAGVTGQPYSSYETVFNSAQTKVATAENMTTGLGQLLLQANGLTISSSSGALSVTTGSDAFAVNAHATEAISATGLNSESFNYASGFGDSTITGLQAGGSASDVIHLNLSMFSGLSSSNTAAQDLASLLSSGAVAQSGANVTITDSAHDVLDSGRGDDRYAHHECEQRFQVCIGGLNWWLAQIEYRLPGRRHSETSSGPSVRTWRDHGREGGPCRAEEPSELGPGIQVAHVNHPDRFDLQPRRFDHIRARRLSRLQASPEPPLSSDKKVLVGSVGGNGIRPICPLR